MDLSVSNRMVLQPAGWERPKGYANGILTRGQLLFTAGLVGWDGSGQLREGFIGQFEQILENTVAVLQEGGASPEHIVRMTWYIVDRDQYLSSLTEIGRIYREKIGRVFPAMAVVQVSALVEPEALIEIESTAVIPD